MKRYLAIWSIVLLIGCSSDVDLLNEVLSPIAVSLVFPEDNSLCTTGIVLSDTESEVTFEWTQSENADSYRVVLINLETNETDTFTAETNSLDIRLLRSTPYSWYVTSVLESSDNTSDSAIASFYNAGPGLSSYAPFPATDPSPQQNAQLPSNTTTITLEWQSSDLDGDIATYDVFFGTTSPPGPFAQELTSNSLENIDVTSGTQYFWRVLTRDAQGNQSNSQIFSFEVTVN